LLELELEFKFKFWWLLDLRAELDADGGRRKSGAGVSLVRLL